MFDIENIYEPKTLSEALSLYSQHPELTVISGGTDVLIKLREGKHSSASLLSINGLAELSGINIDEEKNIYIGAGTTFADILKNDIVERYLPALTEAVYDTGGPQLRNVATIGGNLCNGATSADSAPCLFAYDAQLQLQTATQKRVVSVLEFYRGPGDVKLLQGELLTAVIIPRYSYEGYFGNSFKYAMREAMDIATINCSTNVKLTPDGERIEKLRLAYGVAAPTPIRARSTELLAEGGGITESDIQHLAVATLNSVMPRDSWRASKDFRLHLIQELAKRTITECIFRARQQRAGGV